MKQIRTRYFMLVLYPDNQYHKEIMEYLDSDKNPYQGAYILHEPEQDEKKQHWHVMLYFPPAHARGNCLAVQGNPNPRTGELKPRYRGGRRPPQGRSPPRTGEVVI